VAGFAYHVFAPGGSPLEESDPVVAAILAYVARHGPVRPGESVDIVRFFGGAEKYQRDLYAVLAGPVSSIVEWLTRPLAWSFSVTVDSAYWGPLFGHVAFEPLLELDGHTVYGIDWRRLPVDAWLGLMRERGPSGETGPPPAALLRPPPLDRARFDAAVRAALLTLHRPDQLARNPLAGTALTAGGTGAAADRLRATFEAAVARLGDEPRAERLRDVLHRTYLRPAPTQEAAAEVLGLSFSTYRRCLAKAIDELTDRLWAIEIGAVAVEVGAVAVEIGAVRR
jgi:hypothetical protein